MSFQQCKITFCAIQTQIYLKFSTKDISAFSVLKQEMQLKEYNNTKIASVGLFKYPVTISVINLPL